MEATKEKDSKKGNDSQKKKETPDINSMDAVISDGGRIIKMEVDYSSNCDEKIPAMKKLGKDGQVEEAVNNLMSLEKQTRTGADAHSTSRILVALVEICFEGGAWDLMNETIVTLTKKRSQIKMAVTKMVQKCCEYVDQTPNKEVKLKLMDTLRTITAGKIYVEVERARLTHKLALMKEEENNISEAATILQELQVETFGSMDRKEKVELILEQKRLYLLKKDYVRTQIISDELKNLKVLSKSVELILEQMRLCLLKKDYVRTQIISDELNSLKVLSKSVELILEQMRLCLLKKDYVRTQIISKKISTKFFDKTEVDDLKLKFYRLMIDLDSHEGSYLNICRHFRAIYDTEKVKKDEEEKKRILKHVVLYAVLAPYDNEQSDLIHRIKEDRTLEEIPLYKDLLQLFITEELIKWSGLCSVYEKELRSDSTDVFPATDEGKNTWTQLKNRVVEHNIRMMAKYYTRIYLKRMSELLDLSEKESEDFLCQLVVSGTVVARMDRLDGIVNFGTRPEHSQLLNSWADSLHHLMALVNKTTHLINKEEMVHKHLLATAE